MIYMHLILTYDMENILEKHKKYQYKEKIIL